MQVGTHSIAMIKFESPVNKQNAQLDKLFFAFKIFEFVTVTKLIVVYILEIVSLVFRSSQKFCSFIFFWTELSHLASFWKLLYCLCSGKEK